ncbi:hypothetical protein DPMN_045823 [Dreissena polymorpha]|uniref:Uncharacterized protein n=1 Tax=Dreissena polymorpha TaxID=45954 RepID=A0A9D4D787_DREPO|nr:hypothetical protein DPMN_045823 [Dreissena polymorpha]
MSRCPNRNCAAPPEAFLSRSGYSSTARQVCSEHHYYTLLTEHLLCISCEALRLPQKTARQQDSDDEDTEENQYILAGLQSSYPSESVTSCEEHVPCDHLRQTGY